MVYTVRMLSKAIGDHSQWDGPEWSGVDIAHISHWRPESHRACRLHAAAKLAASPEAIHGIFRVQGEQVRCVRTNYFDQVWKDSCVEFFVQPKPDKGYFNCEFNCGGAFLCGYIVDPTRDGDGTPRGLERLPESLGKLIRVRSSLPSVTNPEASEATDWTLQFHIPFSIFEPYTGPVQPNPGDEWRCNFFKCAEEVQYPHWASWAPVDEFNFHLPRCFGTLRFES